MHQPLLIADSGGTKTDWCYIDEKDKRHFFTTESYHPVNWTDEFVGRISEYWNQLSNYKAAELHFFCAGCLKVDKAKELESIFNKIGFLNVRVKSDLHAAGLALYGNENGNVAILGTGSVFFEWKNQDVVSIVGGKGFEIGDEGSGFYFGKLIFQAYKENNLTIEQQSILEKTINISELENALQLNKTKEVFSQIPNKLKRYITEFSNFHEENLRLFFEPIKEENSKLFVRIVGGYFSAHTAILRPYLLKKDIEVELFTNRPIDSLVDYFVHLSE